MRRFATHSYIIIPTPDSLVTLQQRLEYEFTHEKLNRILYNNVWFIDGGYDLLKSIILFKSIIIRIVFFFKQTFKVFFGAALLRCALVLKLSPALLEILEIQFKWYFN